MGQFKPLRGMELQVGIGLLTLPRLIAPKLSILSVFSTVSRDLYRLLIMYVHQPFRACQDSTRPNGE